MKFLTIRKFIYNGRRYIKSLICGFFKRKKFQKISIFLFFIGYPRSGHSFIGAILDAHPNAIIGMEVDVLDLVRLNYKKNQIFYIIIRNSKLFTKKHKNIWTGYSYAIPEQYQGKFSSLEIIGDKLGGTSTRRLGEDFSLFHKLKELTGCRIKILHVIRHPLDNITTMITRQLEKNKGPVDMIMEKRMNFYFKLAMINDRLRKSKQIDVLDIYHEDFISNPEDQLKRILDFIGLDPIPDYIKDCASRVYKEPHLSRNNLIWPDNMKREISDQIRKISFLKRYLPDEE